MAVACQRPPPLAGPEHLPRFHAALARRAGLRRVGRRADAGARGTAPAHHPARALPAPSDTAALRRGGDRAAADLFRAPAARPVPGLLPRLAAALRRRVLSGG